MVAGITTLVAWAVTALFLSLIPSFAETVIGTHDLAVPGGIVTLMLGAAALVQVVGQRWASLPTQIGGLGLLTVGLLALILTARFKLVVLLLAAAVLAGCGLGLAFMGALGDISEIAPVDRKGDIVASFYVVTYIGTAIPVIDVGLIALHASLFAAVQIFSYAAIALCFAGMVALTAEHRRRRTN